MGLPPLDDFKVGKHTKANAQGIKNEWPAIREIPKKYFAEMKDIGELIAMLFGLDHEVSGITTWTDGSGEI